MSNTLNIQGQESEHTKALVRSTLVFDVVGRAATSYNHVNLCSAHNASVSLPE